MKTFFPLLLSALLSGSCPQKLLAYQGLQLTKRTAQAAWYTHRSAGLLQQLVALIALYPDSFASELLTAPRFRGSDHAEQKEKASKPQAKWQVGTVTSVRPYKVPNSDPSITSYKVSVKVGNTVYVVLNTPRPGTDIGIYARGRQVPVLVEEHTITYNDRLGHSFKVPILSRTTVVPPDGR